MITNINSRLLWSTHLVRQYNIVTGTLTSRASCSASTTLTCNRSVLLIKIILFVSFLCVINFFHYLGGRGWDGGVLNMMIRKLQKFWRVFRELSLDNDMCVNVFIIFSIIFFYVSTTLHNVVIIYTGSRRKKKKWIQWINPRQCSASWESINIFCVFATVTMVTATVTKPWLRFHGHRLFYSRRMFVRKVKTGHHLLNRKLGIRKTWWIFNIYIILISTNRIFYFIIL